MRSQPTSRWAIVGALLLVAGCGGDDDRVPLVPATGSVLVGGKLAAGVQLRFCPAEAPDDPDRLKPTAVTGEDGAFTLGTYAQGDGAPAGRYKVTLYLPAEPPTGSNAPDDLLGGRYLSPTRSPFEATIGPGASRIEPFRAVAVPRPATRPRPANARPDADGVG